MLFEEAVLLAETVKSLIAWRLTCIQFEGGEMYTVRATHRVTGIPYIFAKREDWEHVSEFVQARMMEIEK